MLNHFRERQRAHLSLPGLPALGAVVEGVVAVSVPSSLAIHIVQWAIAGAFVIVAIMARELSIQVDGEQLVFGFGLLRRKLRLADIVSVKIVDTTILKTGIGIHAIADGLVAWVAAPGAAVEVRLSRSNDVYPQGFVVSTARPRDLIAALQSGLTSRAIQ
jgi:hypothetical protein